MTECRILNADCPDELTVVLPRKQDVHYWIEHHNNSFFLRIQDPQRLNSEIAIAPVADPEDQTVGFASSWPGDTKEHNI